MVNVQMLTYLILKDGLLLCNQMDLNVVDY